MAVLSARGIAARCWAARGGARCARAAAGPRAWPAPPSASRSSGLVPGAGLDLVSQSEWEQLPTHRLLLWTSVFVCFLLEEKAYGARGQWLRESRECACWFGPAIGFIIAVFLGRDGCDSLTYIYIYIFLLGKLKSKWESWHLLLGLESEGNRSFNRCYNMTSKVFQVLTGVDSS